MKILSIVSFLLIVNISYAQSLQELAGNFLNLLSEAQREEAVYLLKDSERENLQYVPVSRRGPTFNDFTIEQRDAALAILRNSLSATGYRKSQEIMQLELVLRELENDPKMPDGSSIRDPLNYHICIFGDPFTGKYWGWRFEGHHLSLNFTLEEGTIVSSTPTFWGANPGYYVVDGEVKFDTLEKETELGFTLVSLFKGKQLETAIFSRIPPREIITGNDREARPLAPAGIPFSDMNKAQQQTFRALLEVYLSNYTKEYADVLRKRIYSEDAGNLYFAWAGELETGSERYYRIQSPTLLIEYANTQNNANHVHAVVRDLTNDYGRDVLKDHFSEH